MPRVSPATATTTTSARAEVPWICKSSRGTDGATASRGGDQLRRPSAFGPRTLATSRAGFVGRHRTPPGASMPRYRAQGETSLWSTTMVPGLHVAAVSQSVARSASSQRERSPCGLTVPRNRGPRDGSTPARLVTHRTAGRPQHPPGGPPNFVASVTKKTVTFHPIAAPHRGTRQADYRPYGHPAGSDHQVVGARRGWQ